MTVILFLPGLILALFKNRIANIIFIVFQAIVAIAFLGMVPIGFIFQKSIGVSVIAILGVLISIACIVITARSSLKREVKL